MYSSPSARIRHARISRERQDQVDAWVNAKREELARRRQAARPWHRKVMDAVARVLK
jgi:hypothetical protein